MESPRKIPIKASRTTRLMAFLILAAMLQPPAAKAQSTEAQQLLLNVEKLSQLKNILEDAKKGYTILMNGYNAVKDIAQGNFSLHQVFLDGLMLVSPEVRKYRRIPEIIAAQKAILKEYQSAYGRFSASGDFGPEELAYLGRVYGQLLELSKDNLEELLMVTTASRLRMNDQERLAAIDRIFESVQDKLLFLREFNAQALSLSVQREKARAEIKRTLSWYP